MSTNPASSLTDSWIVNEQDDGNISWAEESGSSGSERPPAYSTKSSRSRRKAIPSHRHSKFKREESPVSHQSDFVMPSADHNTPSRRTPTSSPRQAKTLDQKPMPREPKSRTVSARSTPARTNRAESSSKHDINDVLLSIMDHLLDIIGSTLKKLKQPISWLLAAYLFGGIIMLVQNFLTNSISAALSPVCRIPGVSFLNLPICTYTARYSSHLGDEDLPTISDSPTDDGSTFSRLTGKSKGKSKNDKQKESSKPEFDTLMRVQSHFDDILTDSTSDTALSLPMDMKRSEASIRDLSQVVKFSNIPSKNELLHEFDGFTETARLASYDLQKFNSHVGRAVDNVLATAKWTTRVLDEIADRKKQSGSGIGVIPSFIRNTLLVPFQPVQFNEARVLEQYIVHSRMVSEEITRLIEEAQVLLLTLANLEDRLDVIHGVSLRDNLAAQADRDEILSHLWTFFGGNRKKLGHVDGQLKLLRRVTEYRKLAYKHVSTTVLKLQGMGAELEDLRSRVGAAEVLRDSKGSSDKGGGGVPLDVHIEAIRLGVERLEFQREKAREVASGYTRRVIEAGQQRLDKDGETRLLVEG